MMGRMQPRPLVIIGAGGFGREVADVVHAINTAGNGPVFELQGYIDDNLSDLSLLNRRGERFLGTCDDLPRYASAVFVVGVGNPAARRALDARAVKAGLDPATLIHPSATVGRDVQLGDGCIVCSHVSITTHVLLGRHTHLNLNCTVGHDVVVGDFVTVNPGATISGNVTLDDDVSVGTNAAVIQSVTIGPRSTVGAGAAVVRNVAADTTVVGVPARPIAR